MRGFSRRRHSGVVAVSLDTWKAAAPHEFDVHFHTVPSRRDEDGLGPYYALDAIYKRHDWRNEGKPTATMTFDGEEWAVCMDYTEGGLDPWEENDDFQLETVREFRLYFVAMDELYDGKRADKSQRVRGGHIHVTPRWPNMTSNGSHVDVPDLHPSGWVNVHVQGSNIDFDLYDDLAREVLGAFDFNAQRYLHDERINHTSTINDAAVYVRLQRDESGPIHAADGPLARINGLLRTDRSGYRAFKEDNRKLPGYNVSATFDAERAADLLSGHRFGKECKHYYIRDPQVYDPSEFGYHPKLEVAYQTNATAETVRWSEVEDVERELHETLVNLLDWADLPTRGDTGNGSSGVFFGDVYFDATTEVERNLRVTDCPLPEIENEQDCAVQRVWGKMLDSDRAIFETLVADGGKVSPQEAAEEAGVSYRTVRRFADRCEEVVEHAYGKLEFTSLYARDEVLERLHSAREEFEDAVEDAVMGAADAADGRERSRWSEWKQKYNAQVREDADNCRAEVRVRYDPEAASAKRRLTTSMRRSRATTATATSLPTRNSTSWGSTPKKHVRLGRRL